MFLTDSDKSTKGPSMGINMNALMECISRLCVTQDIREVLSVDVA